MKTSNNNKYKNIVLIGGWTGMSKHKIQYKIDEIYVALPSIDDKETSKILNICKETKCKIKKLPGMYQFLNDEITLEKLKDVEVQDLSLDIYVVILIECYKHYFHKYLQ